jgi:outer membrane protein assembly factor BamB
MKSSLCPLALLALATSTLSARDWPQWRGPNRDGVAIDPQRQLSTLPSDPKVLWKISTTETLADGKLTESDGHASPVIAGKMLVYLDATKGQETAHGVDAATGKVRWSTAVGPVVEFSNYGSGPRCTPIIDGDRVYVQSSGGEFRCLALADGKTLWHVSFDKDYGVTFLGNRSGDPAAKETASRRHGHNGSGVIDGDRIFLPVGSTEGATLVAFDKMKGKELWRAGSDNTAYSSLMVGTLAGVRQVVHLTGDALMGVDVASGKILWREPVKTGAKRHACTPLLADDTVTITSTSIGTVRFGITKSGAEFKVSKVWENKACQTIIGTPTLVGKYLYTVGPGQKTALTCLDFATGKEQWAQPGLADYASITAVNDKLLVHNSTGELILVKANPEKYEELGRTQVCGKTWASPAYADGVLYVRDGANVFAVAIAP